MRTDSSSSRGKWPKQLRVLSEEEENARNQFVKIWHENLPGKFGLVERFNHIFPLRSKLGQNERVLEIGAGLGEHLQYERPDWEQYACVELRSEMAATIRERFPAVELFVGDCQKELPFGDAHFDRILAIHVLEHLPDLPAALKQIRRVLKSEGRFAVCIPCEGGFAYSLAREISAKRIFKKHFPAMNYEDVVVANEHVNFPEEIIQELLKHFVVIDKQFFPLRVPILNINLCIGLILMPYK